MQCTAVCKLLLHKSAGGLLPFISDPRVHKYLFAESRNRFGQKLKFYHTI